MVVGIDEVGRGPWAGPLVMGAVILGGTEIIGITDSKKLSKKKRERLSQEIYLKAKAVGLGWVHADELDEIGLSSALALACRRALEEIKIPYQSIIIDGTVNFLKGTSKGPYVTTMKQADLLIPSVGAASIVAKVARDAYMKQQDELYPHYGFAKHVGYGTAFHKAAIDTYGITDLHRRSFSPIKASITKELFANKISTTDKGNQAEEAAAKYLLSKGFLIVKRNWKTKICEIDIVAKKDGIIYIVEVKYRSSASQGGGLYAIDDRKKRKLILGARLWLQIYGETDLRLSAISVSGDTMTIDTFIESISPDMRAFRGW
jgi:ribonuclease HII